MINRIGSLTFTQALASNYFCELRVIDSLLLAFDLKLRQAYHDCVVKL